MMLSSFDELLAAASAQAIPQRLLLVFVKTSLPKDHTQKESAGFAAGQGGALRPLFCVDLAPSDVVGFAELSSEADSQSSEWDKVLVACMDCPVPDKARIDQALKVVIGRLESGAPLEGLVAFTRDGDVIQFA